MLLEAKYKVCRDIISSIFVSNDDYMSELVLLRMLNWSMGAYPELREKIEPIYNKHKTDNVSDESYWNLIYELFQVLGEYDVEDGFLKYGRKEQNDKIKR